MPTPVIAIFDIGKTNKKVLLFDESYRVVFESSVRFEESLDEDGDPCENVASLKDFVYHTLDSLLANPAWELRAVNFSAYGASFVCLDADGNVVCPLYNYLKPYPPEVAQKFYQAYGGESSFATATASPVLGSLNSGLQLYRIKYSRPEVFARMRTALHLPQYLSHLLTGKYVSDITSIGCHTGLWNFESRTYHDWVAREGIAGKLAPIVSSTEVLPVKFKGRSLLVGTGLHDSSAALIPYLKSFRQPFLLLSTGTWNISLNPFNHSPLTATELAQDCLCYLSYEGNPVKASRFFAGPEFDRHIAALSAFYHLPADAFARIRFDRASVDKVSSLKRDRQLASLPLAGLDDPRDAFHSVMMELLERQVASTRLVLNGSRATQVLVDGGFSRNEVFMHLLALAFPDMEVYAASMSQGSALGAALAIHHAWNSGAIPPDVVSLKQVGRERVGRW